MEVLLKVDVNFQGKDGKGKSGLVAEVDLGLAVRGGAPLGWNRT